MAKGGAAETAALPADEGGTKDYRVGILFVHGMGEQARGDTVTEMGDSLSEWLRRWARPRGDVDVSIRKAILRSSRDTEPGPGELPGPVAHGYLTITRTRAETGEPVEPPETQEWLLAESWWADVFRPATFGELATWVISVGPSVIASQRAGVVQRVEGAKPGWAKGFWGTIVLRAMIAVTTLGLYVAAGLAAALITPLALLLFVLAVLRIPLLSDLALAGARNLAASFGDLLVLVRSPLRFAAMAERVREDIELVGRVCDEVIVVAHSQGSAVAWHALRRMAAGPEKQRAPVRTFVSFGQALRKLKALYRINRTGGRLQGLATLLAVASTAFILALVWLTIGIAADLIGSRLEVETAGIDPLAVGGLAVFALLLVASQGLLTVIAADNDDAAAGELIDELDKVRPAFARFQWLDFWASADPAPNGPLFDAMPDGVTSYRVRNRANTVRDHSIYWRNVTEFVGAVAMQAAAIAAPSPLGIADPVPPSLKDEARIRDRRVTLLAAGRATFFIGAAVAVYFARNDLPDWGRAVLGLLDDLPLIGSWFAGWEPAAAGWLGAAVLVAAALAAWSVLGWAWGLVIKSDEERFFAGQPSSLPEYLAYLWTVLAVVAAAGFLFSVLSLAGELALWPFVLFATASALVVGIVVWLLQAGGRRLYE